MTTWLRPGRPQAPPTTSESESAEPDRGWIREYWPFTTIFVGYPIWWVLGLAEFVWAFMAIPMLAHLVLRGRLVMPRSLVLYGAFLGWMLLSVVAVDSPDRVLGFALRAAYYIGAGVAALYVVNMPGLTLRRVVSLLAWFWVVAIAGGWLGLLVPNLVLATPMQALMPARLLDNELISAMVRPGVADIQDVLGVELPRPKAPFRFTNSWGSNVGILAPIAFAAAGVDGVGPGRRLGRFVLVLGAVPIVLSLNRGLWLSLGIAFVYGTIRVAFSGQASRSLRLAVAVVIVLGVVLLTPLGGIVTDRLATPHSDEGRANLYEETIIRTTDSPFVGFGAPRPSDNRYSPSVGTHGQLWLVVFSHGFVGAGLYLGFLAVAVWDSYPVRGVLPLAAHVAMVVAASQIFFYGQLPQGVYLTLVLAAITARQVSDQRMGVVPR